MEAPQETRVVDGRRWASEAVDSLSLLPYLPSPVVLEGTNGATFMVHLGTAGTLEQARTDAVVHLQNDARLTHVWLMQSYGRPSDTRTECIARSPEQEDN